MEEIMVENGDLKIIKERVSPDDNENKNDDFTIEVDFLTASGSGYEGLNQSFAQMNAELEAEAKELAGQELSGTQQGEIGCDASIRRFDEEILSICYDIYAKTEGKDVRNYIKSYNYNVQTRELLKLEELPGVAEVSDGDLWHFNEDFLSAATYEVSMTGKLEKNSDEYEDDPYFELAWSFSEEVSAWFPDENGIFIRFDSLLSDSDEPIEITVEYDYENGTPTERYYPGLEALLKELSGEWVLLSGEFDGSEFDASEVGGATFTITEDGVASFEFNDPDKESYRYMGISLEEHGLWMGLPALQHLFCQPEDSNYEINFAIQNNQLIVHVVDYTEYYACVYHFERQ